MTSHWRRTATVSALALTTACAGGRGSQPRDEASIANGAHVERIGCIERNNDVVLLRLTGDREVPERHGSGNPSPFADSSGGTVERAPETRPDASDLSTSVNGVWLGSRSFLLSGAPPDSTPAGARVRVTGTVHAPAARAAGTDQMQAAAGARFAELTVESLERVTPDCSGASVDRARHAGR